MLIGTYKKIAKNRDKIGTWTIVFQNRDNCKKSQNRDIIPGVLMLKYPKRKLKYVTQYNMSLNMSQYVTQYNKAVQ